MTDKKRKPAILPHKTKYDTETIDVPNTTENAVTKSGADAKTMSTRLVGNFYFSLVALDACGAACVKEKYVQYDVYCCRREGTDCITYTVIRPDLRDGPPLVNPNP
ncbi:MAG: hypothetical protein IPP40_17425 [bacterium]|nr:hypothetical protein [bacterium]